MAAHVHGVCVREVSVHQWSFPSLCGAPTQNLISGNVQHLVRGPHLFLRVSWQTQTWIPFLFVTVLCVRSRWAALANRFRAILRRREKWRIERHTCGCACASVGDNKGCHCPSLLTDTSTCWLATSGATQQVRVLSAGRLLMPKRIKAAICKDTWGTWTPTCNKMAAVSTCSGFWGD